MADSLDVLKARFDEYKKLVALQFESNKTALDLNAEAVKKHLEVLNHAHEQIALIVKTHVSQDTYNMARGGDLLRIEKLEKKNEKAEGKGAGVVMVVGGVVALLSLCMSALSVWALLRK
jgi:cytochrome c-type biogenesis protein CcmH/NrfG